MSEKRNNSRSFRFSDRVLDILQTHEGDSLNDSFNNLVLYCFDKLPQRKKDLERLEKEIIDKRNKSFELQQKLSNIDTLIRELEQIKRYGEIASRRAKSISEDL